MRTARGWRSTLWRGTVLQGAPHFLEVVVGQLGGEINAALFQRGVDLVGVGVPQVLQVPSRVVRGHVLVNADDSAPAAGWIPGQLHGGGC
jgi:hypothetical protein